MLIKAKGLSKQQRTDIKDLETACCQHEKLSMKLNWDMLDLRSPEAADDFLYYKEDQLVGFLGLYAIDPNRREIELTGMVHPDHRRKGIFRALFNEAKQECLNRPMDRILMITERQASPGTAFTKSTGAQYAFSEYRMKFSEASVPSFNSKGILLRKADAYDHKALKHLDAISFNQPSEAHEEESISIPEDPYGTQYVIELDGKFIGKIGASKEGEDGYIYGFAIQPEYRGHGYGREALSLTMRKLISDGIGTILLEVAVQNDKALSLYKSCGFKEDTVYDYYELKRENF